MASKKRRKKNLLLPPSLHDGDGMEPHLLYVPFLKIFLVPTWTYPWCKRGVPDIKLLSSKFSTPWTGVDLTTCRPIVTTWSLVDNYKPNKAKPNLANIFMPYWGIKPPTLSSQGMGAHLSMHCHWTCMHYVLWFKVMNIYLRYLLCCHLYCVHTILRGKV